MRRVVYFGSDRVQVAVGASSALLHRVHAHRFREAFERDLAQVLKAQALPDAGLGDGVGDEALRVSEDSLNRP